jgi:hypothetical protein
VAVEPGCFVVDGRTACVLTVFAEAGEVTVDGVPAAAPEATLVLPAGALCAHTAPLQVIASTATGSIFLFTSMMLFPLRFFLFFLLIDCPVIYWLTRLHRALTLDPFVSKSRLHVQKHYF